MLKTLVATTALLFWHIVPASAENLTNAELKKLFPGTYTVKIFNRWDLRVQMARNGTISGTSAGFKDTGKWSIEGGQLCIAWSSWTNGRKGCSALRREKGMIKGRGFYFKT